VYVVKRNRNILSYNVFATAVDVAPYFESLGYPCGERTNPADHAVNLINTDFLHDPELAASRIATFANAWAETEARNREIGKKQSETLPIEEFPRRKLSLLWSLRVALKQTWILITRNVLNYSRNLLAYGVRLGMYRECFSVKRGLF
jgi:hypothetical protein